MYIFVYRYRCCVYRVASEKKNGKSRLWSAKLFVGIFPLYLRLLSHTAFASLAFLFFFLSVHCVRSLVKTVTTNTANAAGVAVFPVCRYRRHGFGKQVFARRSLPLRLYSCPTIKYIYSNRRNETKNKMAQ